MRPITWPFVVLFVVLLGLWLVSEANAHDWYPAICCNERDCRPLDFDEVTITDEGYLLPGGQVIPHDDPVFPHRAFGEAQTTSPDGAYHVCTMDGSTTARVRKPDGWCFWAPDSGT